MFGMMSTLSNFIFLMVMLANATRISSRTVETADLMNSLQSPVIMSHNYPNVIKSMQDNSNDIEGRYCQIEYQVIRKRPGTCVKLSHGVTGCISGEYMNPFHPDCF